MTLHDRIDAHANLALEHVPTISMCAERYEDGSFGVTLMLTGLTSEQQAEAAMQHMERLFCGKEIKES